MGNSWKVRGMVSISYLARVCSEALVVDVMCVKEVEEVQGITCVVRFDGDRRGEGNSSVVR